jgi:hypothetical protein
MNPQLNHIIAQRTAGQHRAGELTQLAREASAARRNSPGPSSTPHPDGQASAQSPTRSGPVRTLVSRLRPANPTSVPYLRAVSDPRYQENSNAVPTARGSARCTLHGHHVAKLDRFVAQARRAASWAEREFEGVSIELDDHGRVSVHAVGMTSMFLCSMGSVASSPQPLRSVRGGKR